MEFPCRDCLVKACCSQYCDKLITYPRIIDMYVASLKQCPDCGNTNNLSCERKSDIKFCFECSKVFQRRTVIKPNPPNELLIDNRYATTLKVGRLLPPVTGPTSSDIIFPPSEPIPAKIIDDITETNKPQSSPYTMEETHDILYLRMPKGEADYILKHLSRSYADEIKYSSIPKLPELKPPSWINKYPTIGPVDEPKDDVEWIVLN